MLDTPPVAPIDPPAIVITASRTEQEAADAIASVGVIDEARIERLGEPLTVSYLRLLPSASVATAGPAGSLTEVRIRGAEANHTLLFVDGISANDPAAGNVPRFELLNADLASRIELVRGPQSALWGSEAIGGVVAIDGAATAGRNAQASAEAGSFGFRRASGSAAIRNGDFGLALGLGAQRSKGIDSFDGSGDRDGYANLALRGRADWRASPDAAFGLSGFHLMGRSEFDGFDPVTFLRADTLDRTRNRLSAGRAWADFGTGDSAWAGQVSASLLASRNLNLLDRAELNETRGRRRTFEGQVERRLTTGAIGHEFILAAGHSAERFEAEDVAFGGFTTQDRSRRQSWLVGEWRGSLSNRIEADLAVRHDRYQRFRDATTLRAGLLGRLGSGLSVAASYGEGIAQPTFFDLYGFFPGSFVGNQSLGPESSKGYELSVRLQRPRWATSLTAYRQTLRHEIVDVFDPVTFLSTAVNGNGKSRRSGIEAELQWRPSTAFRLTGHYAYLKASEPDVSGGQRGETRRPKHSGSVAIDGALGRFSYGVSIAYVGTRFDIDFGSFPATRERLSAYWLAGARAGFDVGRGVEAFVRVQNGFDEDYQDVVGYRTEGRSGHAGLRLAIGG